MCTFKVLDQRSVEFGIQIHLWREGLHHLSSADRRRQIGYILNYELKIVLQRNVVIQSVLEIRFYHFSSLAL